MEIPKTTGLVNYFGSNRMLAPEVGKLLDGCNHVAIPFAGSMCEVVYIKARTIVVNDLNKELIGLARVAADPKLGPKLYRAVRRLPLHPHALADAQAACIQQAGTPQSPPGLFGPTAPAAGEMDPLAWAVAYFACSWMGRGGTTGTDGEFKGGLSTRMDSGGGGSAVRYRSAAGSLVAWRRLLARCEFVCEDAFAFLSTVKDGAGHGVYLDPPFPGPGDAYKHRFDRFGELAERLGGYCQTRVVCRFYDHAIIREHFREPAWKWRFMVGGRTRTNAAAPEVLLTRNCK